MYKIYSFSNKSPYYIIIRMIKLMIQRLKFTLLFRSLRIERRRSNDYSNILKKVFYELEIFVVNYSTQY
jgi:hypothetical protein